MLTGDQKQIKIIDMGVSHTLDRTFQVTASAQMGTERYMAPEQSHGRLSLHSDIWSFGCVLLELCTGNQPYHGVERFGVCAQMQKESPLDYALRAFSRTDLAVLINHKEL
jgi:serine/threonine protein kinase